MRALLWLLLLAALAVGLVQVTAHNDGYALFVWPPWRTEVSMNLLLLLLVVGFLLLHWLLRAMNALTTLPERVRTWRARRRYRQSAATLADAVRYLFEGRYARALASAEAAWRREYEAGVAALIALRAARALHDEERSRLWQVRAEFFDENVRGARLMTEAELALETRDFATAQSLLAQIDGHHIAALRLSLRTAQGLNNWHEVVRLARLLEKARALTAEQSASVLNRARREIAASFDNPVALLDWWHTQKSKDRLDAPLLLLTVRTLLRSEQAFHHAEAVKLLEDFLDQRWDERVVACYADCRGGENQAHNLARIAHAEDWLTRHPRDEKLLLALGRLCRDQKLWGKAQSYLEASIAIQPTQAAQLELAQLFDELERTPDANQMYRTAALTLINPP